MQASFTYSTGFTDGQTIATLPVGFRPATQREYPVYLQKSAAIAIATAYIYPDGRITLINTQNAGYTFCATTEISFIAAS